MALPDLPNFYDMQWVNDENLLTTDANLFMDELIQTLDQAVTLINLLSAAKVITNESGTPDGTVVNDALTPPSKTTAEITALGGDSDISNGSVFFDTDVGKLKVKTASGTIETISSS